MSEDNSSRLIYLDTVKSQIIPVPAELTEREGFKEIGRIWRKAGDGENRERFVALLRTTYPEPVGWVSPIAAMVRTLASLYTGDKLDNSVFTRESLIGMLERLGVNTRDQVAKLSTKNIAAVMVTADLPAFARSGSRIDVAVSALGDATNLTGGTLLVPDEPVRKRTVGQFIADPDGAEELEWTALRRLADLAFAGK